MRNVVDGFLGIYDFKVGWKLPRDRKIFLRKVWKFCLSIIINELSHIKFNISRSKHEAFQAPDSYFCTDSLSIFHLHFLNCGRSNSNRSLNMFFFLYRLRASLEICSLCSFSFVLGWVLRTLMINVTQYFSCHSGNCFWWKAKVEKGFSLCGFNPEKVESLPFETF